MKRAMILAAGRGSRLKSLSNETPKPLMKIQGDYVIAHILRSLASSGFHSVVINVRYLGDKIMDALGDGSKYGIEIEYSQETEHLETAGGIRNALPLLGNDPFIVVNGDIVTNFPFEKLQLEKKVLAHIVLIPKPFYKERGDFSLSQKKILQLPENPYTFSGIGIYRPALFKPPYLETKMLGELITDTSKSELISGEIFSGTWADIGTPEQLAHAQSINTSF